MKLKNCNLASAIPNAEKTIKYYRLRIYSTTTHFVHLDISRKPDTGIDGFLFLTTAGFFLLL